MKKALYSGAVQQETQYCTRLEEKVGAMPLQDEISENIVLCIGDLGLQCEPRLPLYSILSS